MLYKAHRFRGMPDTYNVAAPILKTVTWDSGSRRVREVKTGEEVDSIYDVIHHPGTTFKLLNQDRKVLESTPRYLLYNDVDALEDQYLFPEEANGPSDDVAVGIALKNRIVALDEQGPDINRFIFDLDTDEEVPDQKSGSEGEDSFEDDEDDEEDGDDLEDQSDDDGWEDEAEGERNVFDGLALPRSSANDEMSKFLPYITKHKPRDRNEDMMGQYHKFLQREASKGEKSCFEIK